MIRVCEPLVGELEKKYLCQAIDEGEISSGGKFVRRFEEAFAKWSGNKYAVAVCNGTAALEVASRALTMTTISVPSGTIISCYVAPMRAGASINLHDNVTAVKSHIMRVHLFGARDFSLGDHVVDDLSQYWKPFVVGQVGSYSLYANKLITAGEGGVVVTNDAEIFERAKSYRNLCHSKERFVHEEIGYNFRMSNLQGAVALAQLEQIDKFSEIKQANQKLYFHHLPQEVEPVCAEIPWMHLIRTNKDAGEVVAEMEKRGIECRRFFYPLHRQPCLPRVSGSFPMAEKFWNQTFYLPSGLNLTEKDIIDVCRALRETLRSLK